MFYIGVRGLQRLRQSAKKIIKKFRRPNLYKPKNLFTFASSKFTNKRNMENIENIMIETFSKESVYKVCKDFMATYPEMGEKIFKTFLSQFGESALKFNTVDSIVEVVYKIKWNETEEGFDYWDELYTSLNAAPKKSFKFEYV